MQGLLLIERIILESISKGSKKRTDIHQDTGMSPAIIDKFVSNLLRKNILIESKGELMIDRLNQNFSLINDEKNIREELMDFFITLINNHFDYKSGALKVQKFWPSPSDLSSIQSRIEELQQFIRNIQRENDMRKNSLNTKNKKILFWGMTDYTDITRQFGS